MIYIKIITSLIIGGTIIAPPVFIYQFENRLKNKTESDERCFKQIPDTSLKRYFYKHFLNDLL
jgi:hypothetical protein